MDIDQRKWTHPTPYEAWDLQPRLVPTFAMEAPMWTQRIIFQDLHNVGTLIQANRD